MNPEIISNAPVDVWLIERPGPEEIERWTDLISPEERSRADRFRYPGDREVYIAVHGALREILGGIPGVEPGGITFATKPDGKPEVEGGGASFSISRTEGAALIAVSSSGAVGADIELVSPHSLDATVADRFFSPRERASLDGLEGEEYASAFFRIWTRKEALVKCMGRGIDEDLAAIETDPAPGWTLVSLDLPGPYSGAVAAEGAGRHVSAVKRGVGRQG